MLEGKFYSPKRELFKKIKLSEYGQKGPKIGKGSYGKVNSWNNVAVKTIEREKNVSLSISGEREIAILINLVHINIVPLLDVFVSDKEISLVFEKAECDLSHFIRCKNQIKSNAYYKLVEIYSYQLVRATAYCHSNGIIHRDIKPANILIYGNNLIKLADFGISRNGHILNNDETYLKRFDVKLTSLVVTLWYRAPELLMGKYEYDMSIDNWSLGCVIGEMAIGSALFPGLDEKDTLDLIYGKLKYDKIPEMPMDKYDGSKEGLQNIIYRRSIKIPEISLIKSFLDINPIKRLKSFDALSHEFFDDIKECVEDQHPDVKIFNAISDEILLLRQESIPNKLSSTIKSKMRTTLLKWLYDVVVHWKLSLKTFYLSIHYIDKYVSLIPNLESKYYQAVGIVALNLATDFNEGFKMEISDLVIKCDSIYTKLELIKYKEKLWITIGYDLLISTPYDFTLLYSNNIKLNEEYFKKLQEILIKITLSPQMSSINNMICRASNENLAISCILCVLSLYNKEEPTNNFKINNYHRVLKNEITRVYQT